MNFWWFDPERHGGVAGRAFASLEQVFALAGERVTKDRLSEVVRVEREGRRYYVKRYARDGKSASGRWLGLRRCLASPRVQVEWRNLLLFREWSIPTARLAAYGIERHFGGFRRGALVTEEIREASDLARLARQNDARLRDRRWMAYRRRWRN